MIVIYFITMYRHNCDSIKIQIYITYLVFNACRWSKNGGETLKFGTLSID